MTRHRVSAFLFGLTVAVFAVCSSAPAARAGGQNKVKAVPKKPVTSPFPGHGFPPYGSRGTGGFGGARGIMAPMAFSHSLHSSLGLMHQGGRFGGVPWMPNTPGLVPGVGDWPYERGEELWPFGEREEWPLLDPLDQFGPGLMPGLGGVRESLLRAHDPNREVLAMLGLMHSPADVLATRGVRSNQLRMLGQFTPGVTGLPHALELLEPGFPGLTTRPTGFAGPGRGSIYSRPSMADRILAETLWGTDMLGTIDVLNNGRLSFGGSPFGRAYGNIFDPGLGLGFGRPSLILDPGFDRMPGYPFGGRSRGIYGVPSYGLPGRMGVRPVSPPVRTAPSKDEQRAALEKFGKSLAAVETLAKLGAWATLGTGLEKATASSSLPGAVAAPLRAVQSESAHITDLLAIRSAVTSEWTDSPAAAALEKQLDAVRVATGDRELADRLRRLLAVKAVWEGHTETAAALLPDGPPDLDAELTRLRRPNPDAGPIAGDEDRVLVCRRVVRELLGELDHHLDCGRYSVAVHVRDVRGIRTGAEKLARELGGQDKPKPSAESFQTVSVSVGKALGRSLSATDQVILRRMHGENKTVEEMTAALR